MGISAAADGLKYQLATVHDRRTLGSPSKSLPIGRAVTSHRIHRRCPESADIGDTGRILMATRQNIEVALPCGCSVVQYRVCRSVEEISPQQEHDAAVA